MSKGLIYRAGFVSDFSRYLENPLLLGYGVHTSLTAAISLLINLALLFYSASE